MKNIFVLCTLFACLSVSDLCSQIYVGFCDDNIAAPGLAASKSDADVSAAIKLTSSELGDYQRAEIQTMAVGLSSISNITRLTIWVRSDYTDSESLIEQSFDVSELKTGWNYLKFTDSYTLKDDESLYCGYTFHQSERVSAVSYSGEIHNGGFYFGIDGKWKDYSETKSPASIRLGLGGENIAAKNLSVRDLTISRYFVKKGTPLTVSGSVKNIGSSAVSSYDIIYKDNASAGVTLHKQCELNYGTSDSFSFTFIPSTDDTADVPVMVSVENPDGVPDEKPHDNIATVYYQTFDKNYISRKNVLLEEFVSEDCGYSPAGVAFVDSVLKDMPQVIRVSHHAGWRTDDFTLPESQTCCWLFGSDYSYAPALMLDRTYLESYAASFQSDGVTFSSTQSRRLTKEMIQTALAEPTFVDVELSGRYDLLTGEVKLTVSGTALTSRFAPSPRISLFVVENNVSAVAQDNYYADKYPLAGHNSLLRKSLTGSWGAEIAFDENSRYSETFSTVIDASWNPENIKIVAAVGGYDKSVRTENRIYNSAVISLSDIAASSDIVKTEPWIITDANGEVSIAGAEILDIWTLSGERVENGNLLSGRLYFIRILTASNELGIVKYLVK